MKWLKDAVLSKRSDNAFRSIMVGDPKIRLWEIGIPEGLASNLVVSEPVSTYNLENMNLKCNLHLLAKEELFIRRNGKLMFIRKANQLEVGDIAYRPLQDGDLILINRPPSVHQHSLIALSTKILPIQSVVSINPLCCTPFLGDFDGDCLHGYIPQSIQSRIELGELVSLHQQLLNMQDGRSLVSLTHDSLAAAHLLTSTDVFLKKSELQQLQMLCLSVSKTPAPAVVKSMDFQGSLWTGKQLFSMLLPSGMNFSCDRKLHIIDSEVLTCSSGSSWLQILLDPINISVLKCLDETEDVTYRQSDYIQNNLSVVRSSIMAFKDVFSDLLKMVQQVSNDNSEHLLMN